MPVKTKLSLSQALVQALRTCVKCGEVVQAPTCGSCRTRLKPRPVKDVIDAALELWESPAGKTPRATASAQLLYITRDGLAAKPERGMVVAAFPKK